MSTSEASCAPAVAVDNPDPLEPDPLPPKMEHDGINSAEVDEHAIKAEPHDTAVVAPVLSRPRSLPNSVASSASHSSPPSHNGDSTPATGAGPSLGRPETPPQAHREAAPPERHDTLPVGPARIPPLGRPETPPQPSQPMEVVETFVTVHGERPSTVPRGRDSSAAKRTDRGLLSDAVAWMRPAGGGDTAGAAPSYTVTEVVAPTGAARRKATGVAPTRRVPRTVTSSSTGDWPRRPSPADAPPPLPFDCDACQTRFGDRLALATHQREHGASPAEPCRRCGRLLAAPLDRARHQRRHRATGPTAAAGAGAAGSAAATAVAAAAPTRLLPQRRGRGPTRCGVCGGQFRAGALREHLAPHPRTGHYACTHCGDAFAQRCQLERHGCPSSPARSPPPLSVSPASPPESESESELDLERELEQEPPTGDDDDDEDEGGENPPARVSQRLSSGSEPVPAATAARSDGCGADAGSGGGSDGDDDGGGGAARHECPHCGRRFATARNLSRHARLHADTSQVACEVCERVYSRLDALVRHSVEAHDQVRQFQCPRCRWKFTQKRILEYHLKIHEEGGDKARGRGPGRSPRPHRCRLCKRTFIEAAHLETHECRADHATKPAYVCDICGKSIKTKMWLSRHRLLHDAVRPAKCDTCGQGFIDDKALAKHAKNHTDGRRFLCDICGKGFALKVTLQIHARTHTGERPYACEVCGKRFSTRTQLFHHAKIHSGEKPYVCSVCSRGFRQSHHLKTHMKVHRPEREAGQPQRPTVMLVLDAA